MLSHGFEVTFFKKCSLRNVIKDYERHYRLLPEPRIALQFELIGIIISDPFLKRTLAAFVYKLQICMPLFFVIIHNNVNDVVACMVRF